MRRKCFECKQIKTIRSNGLCIKCNSSYGIRECKKCKELLFEQVDFPNQSKGGLSAVCFGCLERIAVL